MKKSVVKWAAQCTDMVNLKCQTANHEVLKSLDWKRNVFLVSNHQSYMDIAPIYVATQKMFGFLAKYELSKVPFLNFWMRVQGCVFINRARYISAIKILKKMEIQKKRIRLVLFPEGTRSKTGKLGKFKTGALKIAWQLDGLIVPTIIQGTRQAWEDRILIYHKYPVKIVFGETLDLKKIKTTRSFKEFLQEFETNFHAFHEKSI